MYQIKNKSVLHFLFRKREFWAYRDNTLNYFKSNSSNTKTDKMCFK